MNPLNYCNEINEKTIMAAIELLHHRSYPPDFYLKLIRLFLIYHEQLEDDIFLDFAFKQVYVYSKKGYSYEGIEELFNKIVQAKTNMNLEEFIKSSDCIYRTIKPSAFSISGALGRWCPSKNKSKTKKFIVEEILKNIKTDRHGTYKYENIHHGLLKITYVTIEEGGTTYIVNHEGRAVKILPF